MTQATPLPINPPPGVVKTESELAISGRYIDADMVRFVRGRAEKRGGWVKAFTGQTSGVPRTIHAWRSNSSLPYLAAGTFRKLYVYDENLALIDITPFRSQGTLPNDPFAVSNGAPLVLVTHNGHGLNAGDTIVISGATLVGTIDPNGTWTVNFANSVNQYTYVAGSNANANTTGGGAAVTFKYEIPVGTELGAYGLGWGVGGWGLGTWGSPHDSSTIFIEPRIWALDHFGQILLGTYNGGTVFQFDPTQSKPWPRALAVTGSPPTDCRYLVVTQERFVMVLRNGMIVHWCDQGNFNFWTAGQTGHTAQTRTLTIGTKLVAARVVGPLLTMVWSDAAAWIFQFTGSQFVFDSRLVGRNCGLIAPGAAVVIGGVAYWMGQNTFWMYDGTLKEIPNVQDIKKFVFDQLDPSTTYQCSAVYNPIHNEVEFFYTPLGNTSPQKSVIFHINDQCWSPHNLGRASGTNFDQGDTRPYMGGSDGFIYQHENTFNDNGAALPWHLTIAAVEMSSAQYSMDLEGIIFDFKDQIGTIIALVEAFNYMNDGTTMDVESELSPVTGGELTDFRIGGRYMRLGLSCGLLDCKFRMGASTAYVKQAGMRR